MSKKRAREPPQVNVALVEIYEDLAHENEDVRRRAASALLTVILPASDSDQIKTILTRLFRGLCSGRKAARPGFAVALTETLYQLKSKQDRTISASQVLDILEQQTKSDGNSRGQDERDHYFGRVFGSEAIIRSELLFDAPNLEQWDRLLDLVCDVASKKPWLRQECGWVLYSCVRTSLHKDTRQKHAVRILEKLNEHKLIRSPEGLAIWIQVRRSHPKARLPKNVWKQDDPLARKDLRILADVLKNAKAGERDDTEFEVQGSATWAVNLHFVWDVVLDELFFKDNDQDDEHSALVEEFWRVTLDEALFAPSSSQERKHWGFLVMQKSLEKVHAPSTSIGVIFSKRAVQCLVTSLKSPDRYLQHSARAVVQTLQKCIANSPEHADLYIICLLHAVEMGDFDSLTNTKTVEDLLNACSFEAALGLAVAFNYELSQAIASNPADVTRNRKLILNYQSKLIAQQANAAVQNSTSSKLEVVYTILHAWVELSFGRSDFDENMRKFVREKIQVAFEQILKIGRPGQNLMLDLVEEIYRHNPTELVGAETEILKIVKTGWQRFEKVHDIIQESAGQGETNGNTDKKPSTKSSQTSELEAIEGLAQLYGLILFEIHSGDVEAVQILQELLDYEAEDALNDKSAAGVVRNADALVEILLSFASRPSRFLRRLTLTIFEALTPHLTRNGLQSLTAVLETKETKAGQQELFEANGDNDVLEDGESVDGSDEGSDIEMLDSDVEVLSASESGSEGSDDSQSDSDKDSESNSSDDEADTNNAELLALETSLAAALGTRKLTQDDMANASSSSDNGSDMSDSDMMALDDKLAEVFRNRAQSSNESKKKDNKKAKENIVNFKNRVLDMLEAYIRREYLNTRSLEVVLPLLALARESKTKQVADRAIKLLVAFCKRCGGLQKVPILPPVQPAKPSTEKNSTKKDSKKKKSKRLPSPSPSPPPPNNTNSDSDPNTADFTPLTLFPTLHEIHTEFSLPNTSNAHRNACSKASILVSKVLLKAGVSLAEIDAVYAHTQTTMDGIGNNDGERVRKGFFEDWELWKKSVEGRI